MTQNHRNEEHPDIYSIGPVTTTFEDRRQEFITHVLNDPIKDNPRSIWHQLISILGGKRVEEDPIFSTLKFIDDRNDCADFAIHTIMRLVYQYDPNRSISNPNAKALNLKHPPSQKVLSAAKETILNFKYWPDEPGIDSMCTWTENHYILFSSAAYLVGQLYPGEIFTNSGETGQEKIIRNRPRILRWLDMRFKSGFSEWLSNVYYEEDLGALMSLHDFCLDDEIREKATKIIDLILLDMVLNQFKGVFGSTHGRSYERNKKWANFESSATTMKLLFGQGIYAKTDGMGFSPFVVSNYQIPPVLHEIFQHQGSFVNYQRSGFLVVDQEKWDWDYDSLEDGMLFYTNEGYLHPSTTATTLKMFDAFNWWENEFFSDFKPYRWFLKTIKTLKLIKPFSHLLERDICRNMRDEVNIYTYKTPNYMLSTAQDYRKGFGGDQHHIWQATLGPNAVCFTTHPGPDSSTTPNYWTGSGLLPRSAQVKNLNISIYKIEKLFPALYVPIRNFYTHAWIPRDQFDEVVEKEGWIFARKDKGYLALHSQQPYLWHTEGLALEGHNIRKNPEDFNREVIAPGKHNIWICQLGRLADNGPFEEFIQTILNARLIYNGLEVEFHSPGNGVVKFGWEGPLTVDGEVIDLKDYPRYDNPFVSADLHPNEIHIRAKENELYLNWKTGERRI